MDYVKNLQDVYYFYSARKYNGWRVDVKDREFYTYGRFSGVKKLNVPSCIKKITPPIRFTAELWYDDKIDVVKRIVGRKRPRKLDWELLKIKVFCIDSSESVQEFNKKFAMYFLPGSIFEKVEWQHIKPENIIKTAKEMKWEGVVFKKKGTFLKWKNSYDYEGKVVGYFTDGVTECGSLEVATTWDNQIISIAGGKPEHVGKQIFHKVSGLNDKEKRKVRKFYPVGSIVKFKFNGVYSSSAPISPNIYRGGNK